MKQITSIIKIQSHLIWGVIKINKKLTILSLIILISITFLVKNHLLNRPFTVCIDAGHGGYDVGTKSSNGILEKNISLDVALKLGAILEKSNIKVVYTRNSDKVSWASSQKASLRKRCSISNKAKADIFLSIHCNADKNSYKTKGIETWCRFSDTSDEKLSKSIHKELVNLDYSYDRGLKYERDGRLYVLQHTNAVSSLVELGFLSNSEDTKFLADNKSQIKCAQAIANGVINYKAKLTEKDN